MSARSERDAAVKECEGWRRLVGDYLAELENPAPDFTMRIIYRKWMADALADPTKLQVGVSSVNTDANPIWIDCEGAGCPTCGSDDPKVQLSPCKFRQNSDADAFHRTEGR